MGRRASHVATGRVRLHGVNPYEYVKDLLIRVQVHPADAVDELLPWNWISPPDSKPGTAP